MTLPVSANGCKSLSTTRTWKLSSYHPLVLSIASLPSKVQCRSTCRPDCPTISSTDSLPPASGFSPHLHYIHLLSVLFISSLIFPGYPLVNSRHDYRFISNYPSLAASGRVATARYLELSDLKLSTPFPDMKCSTWLRRHTSWPNHCQVPQSESS